MTLLEKLDDHFPHLMDMSYDQLALRREILLDTCVENGVRIYAQLSDTALSELFAVNRLMRKKNSGPPKKAKGPSTLDDLA